MEEIVQLHRRALGIGIALSTLVMLVAQVSPASADTDSYSMIVRSYWVNDAGGYVQRHNGDDIGVNVSTNDDMDVRWVTCSGSSHGATFHLVGDGQGAVRIGNNFRAGTCLDIEARSHTGLNTGSFSAGIYWNYNIS